MRQTLIVTLCLAQLAACSSGESAEEIARKKIDALETQVTTLDTRVQELEDANKNILERYKIVEAERQKAESEDSARLENLRAGQKQVEAGQKLLCDATNDC